jgi:hypothetical protein
MLFRKADDKMDRLPGLRYDAGAYGLGVPSSPVAVLGEGYLPEGRVAGGEMAAPTPQGSIDNLLTGEMTPTLNPLGLDEATDYFRKNYIPTVAKLTGKTYISHLARPSALDLWPSGKGGLSNLVNGYGLKPRLEEIREELGEMEKGRDVPSELMDPIVRRVVREAISGGYFGLTDATERFKDIYVNNLARYFGETEAAKILDVTTRTVLNRVERYLSDKRNALRFPDDRIVEPNLEQIAEAIESSTKKQPDEEIRHWQQQMTGFSQN